MATADEVKVVLTAENKAYLKNLQEADAKYKQYLKNLGVNSEAAQKVTKRADEGRAKVAAATAKHVKRQNDLLSKSYKTSARAQAKSVDDGTDRIKKSLQEQIDAQKRAGEGAGRMAGIVKKSFGPLLALAAGAGGLSIAKTALDSARAIQISADAAGISAERFQEMAFAARQVGVDQDKLSDILRDVNDRVGDFVSTGAGPFVDFMEAVGYQAGLTADSFRDLTSDQVLGLYVKTLEEAGANQQDMTFFLESLSGDASLLSGVLENGGAEMRRYSAEARDMGLVLSNEAAANANEANKALSKLSDIISLNLRNSVLQASPEIERLANNLSKAGPEISSWFTNVVKFANDGSEAWVEAFARMNRASTAFNLAKQGQFSLAGQALDQMKTQTQLEEEAAKLAQKRAESLASELRFMKQIRAGRESDNERMVANAERWLERQRGITERISDEIELLEKRNAVQSEGAAMATGPNPDADFRSLLGQDDTYVRERPKGLGSNTEKEDAAKASEQARLAREILVIEALGRKESEQIEALKQQRLESIKAAGLSATESAALIAKVEMDAQAAQEANAERTEQQRKRNAEAEIRAAEDVRQAKASEEQMIAEIAAATARMQGRTLEGIQIELDAQRKRYQDEIDNIEMVAAARAAAGLDDDPNLAANRLEAQAGLLSVDEEEGAIRDRRRSDIQGVSDGAQGGGLSSELARLEEEQAEKMALLTEFYAEDLSLKAEFEAEKLEIEAEFSERRKEARLSDLEAQLDEASNLANTLGRIGKEGSAAAKAAAKVQKGIALGRASVNAAMSISEAVASAPFPANIPAIAFATAVGGAQVAAIASQSYDGGGRTQSGSRSGGVDGKGGFFAIMHPNEVIADMTRPGREVAGQSLQSAFGIQPSATPNVGVPGMSQMSAMSRTNNLSFGGNSVTVNGGDDGLAQDLKRIVDQNQRDFAQNVNAVLNVREKRTVSRTERPVGVRS